MSDFAYETKISTRYQDLDALGHVNNAVYATYLEEARISYFRDELGLDTDEIATVVVHLELDFEAPLTDPQTVTVGIDVSDIGAKSFTLAYEIADGGATYATGETVLVWIDRETGTSISIPEPIRAKLSDRDA